MNRPLVLMSGFFAGGDYYESTIASRGIAVRHSLKSIKPRVLRALRRVHLRSGLPGATLWFDRWVNEAGDYDSFIIHGADLLIPVARHLARKFPDRRVIFWYWNPSGAGSDPRKAAMNGVELWSFDSADCARFEMNQNTTYSFIELAEYAGPEEVDFFFFGSDKGRSKSLAELAEWIDAAGLTHHLYIVDSASPAKLSGDGPLIQSDALPYLEIVKLAARSRVIVEILQEGQTGVTLRALEALQLERKLLTNATEILSSPLYHPSRVFVLGRDDPSTLLDFVRTPMVPPSAALKQHYDFDGWLDRFRTTATASSSAADG